MSKVTNEHPGWIKKRGGRQSSRNQIVGWLSDAIKIHLTAPPEKGRANEAVVELLSTTLGISTDDIEVRGGHPSPSKSVATSSMDDDAIKKAFA